MRLFLDNLTHLFFVAVLGFCCCVGFCLIVWEWGLLSVAVLWLLTVVASLVSEHLVAAGGLSSCGSQALEHRLSNFGAQA